MEIFTFTEIIVSSRNEINLYKIFMSWRSRLDLEINNTKVVTSERGTFLLNGYLLFLNLDE